MRETGPACEAAPTGAGAARAAAPRAAAAREVTFYVLEESSNESRLRLACRLTDKAYRAGQRVLIWHADAGELAALDDLLWTFGDDRAFVPHERLTEGASPEAPVLLAARETPPGDIDVLINLAPHVPPSASRASRIVEIVDGEPARRAAGRARFKAYRELGWALVSHNVR